MTDHVQNKTNKKTEIGDIETLYDREVESQRELLGVEIRPSYFCCLV
jgi:hypothetical protein